MSVLDRKKKKEKKAIKKNELGPFFGLLETKLDIEDSR